MLKDNHEFKHYISALLSLSIREIIKFLIKGRLFSAIPRPALWLFVFAAGVGSAEDDLVCLILSNSL